MPRKGLNIYKRKDGRWEGRYIKGRTSSGKVQYGYLYGQSYGELKQKLLMAEATQLTDPACSEVPKVLFGHLLDLWLQAEKSKTKESTYACYYRHIQKHIRPQLGMYPLDAMDVALFEAYAQELSASGRLNGKGGLSPKTVSDILGIVKSVIEYGKYLGYPVRCSLHRLSAKRQEKEMRVLSKEEQELLERTLLSDTDLSKFGILISLYTGIRIGELCALTWKCIDPYAGVLLIQKTLQRIQSVDNCSSKTRIIITEPKSSCSHRKIPLPKCIARIAQQLKAEPEAFVLTGDIHSFVEPRTLQYRFSRYVKCSGITPANFHSLRHTFATRCIEHGFDIKSLSEILGHANVNITLNRYVHSSFDLKQENMKKLSFMAPAF